MLSEEQKKLVEDNHNLIKWFAGTHGISLEEYYDILAIALCKAALKYDPEKSLFSTYAVKTMSNEYCLHMRRSNTKSRYINKITISYDQPIFDCEYLDGNCTILDTLFNEYDSTEDKAIMNISIKELMPLLSETEQQVILLIINGLTQRQIAEKIGVSQPQVSRIVKKIKQKIIM